jgi:hypothetical protein
MATVTTESTEKSTAKGTSKSMPIFGWAVPALVVIAAVVAALLLNDGSRGAGQPATVNASEANANSKVSLHVGDRLVVTLDGNPTTGYTWEVASSDAAILKPIGEAQFTPATSAVGSGGKVTL